MSEPSRNKPSSIQHALAKGEPHQPTEHKPITQLVPQRTPCCTQDTKQPCSHMLKQGNSEVQCFMQVRLDTDTKKTLKQLAQSELHWRYYKVAANPPIGSFRISMAKMSEQPALCQPGGESEMTKDNNDRGSTILTGLGANCFK